MLPAPGVTTVDDGDGYELRCLCRTADVVSICLSMPVVVFIFFLSRKNSRSSELLCAAAATEGSVVKLIE